MDNLAKASEKDNFLLHSSVIFYILRPNHSACKWVTLSSVSRISSKSSNSVKRKHHPFLPMRCQYRNGRREQILRFKLIWRKLVAQTITNCPYSRHFSERNLLTRLASSISSSGHTSSRFFHQTTNMLEVCSLTILHSISYPSSIFRAEFPFDALYNVYLSKGSL